MTNVNWGPIVSDRSFFTLYLGNRDGRNFLEDDRVSAFRIVGDRFPSFTVLNGQGFYKGKPLPTLIFQIATKDRYSLAELCQELCIAFDQNYVGVANGGGYTSVPRRGPDDPVKMTEFVVAHT